MDNASLTTTIDRDDLAHPRVPRAPLMVLAAAPVVDLDRQDREDDARVTAKLALITGAGVLIVLVVFLTMMVVIAASGGPA